MSQSIPQNIQADCLIVYPVCNASKGELCSNTEQKKDRLKYGQSHFGRRLKRILTLGRLPEEKL
jgi:hypothetical protein